MRKVLPSDDEAGFRAIPTSCCRFWPTARPITTHQCRSQGLEESEWRRGGSWPWGQAGRPAQGPSHGPVGEGEEGEGCPLAPAHPGPQEPPEGPVP